MTLPRLFDSFGNHFALGKELGRGGEGAVYDIPGRLGFVAKIYIGPKPSEHGQKLAAMVAMAEPRLLSLAAWPTGTLHNSSGSIVGFVMPKINGHSPVFKLYGPKLRLQEFPTADWRFLIHAAANTARAFSTVHAAGHIIGDVNHGNLVVGRDATVRLIDCDSFQVSAGPRRWLCEVGVGTHQPPEMQLASYASVVRTPNHDNFGLAVLIFQMLCMGRHPFAGRFLATGTPPTIDEAIAKSQYAYSRDQRRTMMAPPPGSLPIDALTPELQQFFENAFTPTAVHRPSGERWVGALQQLASNLQACKHNQAHRYLSKLPHCPWCQIEATSGTLLFPVVFVGIGGAAMGFAALWQEVTRIVEPTPLPPPPDPAHLKAQPAPPALAAAKSGRTLAYAAYISIAIAILLPILIASSAAFWLNTIIVGLLTSIIIATARKSSPEKDRLSGVAKDWDALMSTWHAPPSRFSQIRQGLNELKAKHDALPSVRAQRLQRLADSRRQKQLQDFLDRHSVASAKISGIGPAKVAMLGGYGIDTAGDVVAAKVMTVPGFGKVTTGKLVAWRQHIESRFKFDPNKEVASADILAVQRDISLQATKIEQDAASGLATLKAIVAGASSRRQSLESKAAELAPRYAQAVADAAVMPISPIAHKRLMGLAGAATAITLLSHLPNSAPQALTVQRAPQAAATAVTSSVSEIRSGIAVTVSPTAVSTISPPPISASAEPIHDPGPADERKHVQARSAVNMRLSPDNMSPVVRMIPQGAVLVVFVRRNGWVQVGDETPLGWIYSGFLVDVP